MRETRFASALPCCWCSSAASPNAIRRPSSIPGAAGGFIGGVVVPVAGFLWEVIPKKRVRLKYELTLWFFLEKEVPYKIYQAFLWAFLTAFVILGWLQLLSGCTIFAFFCLMLVVALTTLSRVARIASMTEAKWERQYLEFVGIDPPGAAPEALAVDGRDGPG
jgi:hypothetical protein